MGTNHRLAGAGLAAGTLLFTAACSGGANSPSTPNAATSLPTPSAAASTTPSSPSRTPTRAATLTREQAAKRYLAIVKVINDELAEPKCKAVQDFFVDGGSWPPNEHPEYGEVAYKVMKACFKAWLPNNEAVIRQFQTTPWPVDAREDMADLILFDQALLRCYRQGARATSDQDIYDAFECLPKDDGSPDRVRARFGLPRRSS
jgi:hypothetical protein